MACPYFMPTSRHEEELWAHRQRLSLGDGFAGCCTAPGRNGCAASDAELKDLCNLGYASACEHLPAERLADAVRFVIARFRQRTHAPLEQRTRTLARRQRTVRIRRSLRSIHRHAQRFRLAANGRMLYRELSSAASATARRQQRLKSFTHGLNFTGTQRTER